ncbi:MAG: squalene/phytoene synthase family protein [Bacteroidales bacterium]|nr:MAG: squalene/phytoene synthase family protein [Bacteroidales bacterium]
MSQTKFKPGDIINIIDFAKIYDHPNILIAARFWEDERYNAAKICYKFMRSIDDMIDDYKAGNGSLTSAKKKLFTAKVNDWISSLEKSSSDDPFIKEVIETVTNFKIPLKLFHNFAKSMIYDINNDGFVKYNDFLLYAEGASVAPASLFVHLCCLKKENGEYISPSFDIIEVARPCALFSYLVHIIRDFQKDQLDNLNYFAIDILKKNKLIPSDLKRMANGEPVTGNFRNVIKEYYERAEDYRLKTQEEIKKLTSSIETRYLLSLHIIYNLYLQVFERIDISDGNFTTEELNPSPLEIKNRVIEVIDNIKIH